MKDLVSCVLSQRREAFSIRQKLGPSTARVIDLSREVSQGRADREISVDPSARIGGGRRTARLKRLAASIGAV